MNAWMHELGVPYWSGNYHRETMGTDFGIEEPQNFLFHLKTMS